MNSKSFELELAAPNRRPAQPHRDPYTLFAKYKRTTPVFTPSCEVECARSENLKSFPSRLRFSSIPLAPLDTPLFQNE